MDHLEELRGDMRDLKSNPDGDPDDIEFGDRILWAIQEIERLRLSLREIVRMAGKGADAPMTAERWLDRIDETAIAALSPKEEYQ